MMKKIIFLAVFAALLVPVTAPAQSNGAAHSPQLNLGVGLSGWGIPFYIGMDFWVDKDITVGGELTFRHYRENYKSIFYYHNIMGVSGNGNYHFNRIFRLPPRWDLYAGLNLGFFVWASPEFYPGTHSSGLGLGGQLGTRYFLSDKVGLNLEVGSGNAFSGGKFGLTMKL